MRICLSYLSAKKRKERSAREDGDGREGDENEEDSPSRNDPSALGIHGERSNEIGVTCESPEAFSSAGRPDFHAVLREHEKKRCESARCVSFEARTEARKRVDSRSIVAPTNDVVLLEINASQSSLVSLHRPDAFAREDVPDLDLPVSRSGSDSISADSDGVDGTSVACKGVDVLEVGAGVDEEVGVFGAGEGEGGTRRGEEAKGERRESATGRRVERKGNKKERLTRRR